MTTNQYVTMDSVTRAMVRGHVRWTLQPPNMTPSRAADTFADLLARYVLAEGEIDTYWLRCYELADRLDSYRRCLARKSADE